MRLTYYLQKLVGNLLKEPIIPEDKTCGFSVLRSDISGSEINDKSRIFPPFYLQHVQLGAYSYIAANCRVANAIIGRCCSIGPNFCCGLGIHPTDGISTAPMFYSQEKQNGMSFCRENKIPETQLTTIGNDVFIGANVTVLDGVTIGDGAVIGAGAVVSKDIPPYAIAVGCPIRIIRYRLSDTQIAAMQRIQWWNWSEEQLKEVEKMFDDIDGFIEKYDSSR